MPVSVLTDAERARLSGFPKETPTEDLVADDVAAEVEEALADAYDVGAVAGEGRR